MVFIMNWWVMTLQDKDFDYAISVISEQKTINEIPIRFRDMVNSLISNQDTVLQYAKNKQWNMIKEKRNEVEQAGLPFKGKVLDYDMLSVIRLNQAKDGLNALISNGTMTRDKAVIDWTMQDNTVMQLTINDLESIPIYAVQYSNELHQKARKLRDMIDNAKDIKSILAINWQ